MNNSEYKFCPFCGSPWDVCCIHRVDMNAHRDSDSMEKTWNSRAMPDCVKELIIDAENMSAVIRSRGLHSMADDADKSIAATKEFHQEQKYT